VALYISFANSLLEEFFFRGFSFVCLKKSVPRGFAYLFSALMFALYHSGMTTGWFNFGIFALTLVDLMIAGIIFDFLNEKSGNIYTSWVVHMFANFGINTVGFILFGII
jgi:membrane protease YdiL (CAAX protease family)